MKKKDPIMNDSIMNDNSIIGKMIGEYAQIINRQEALEKVNKRLQEALGLANAMILGGEKHSERSKSIIHDALFQREELNNEAYTDQYGERRELVEKVFDEYIPVEEDSEEFISPSGNYKLVTIPYRAKKGCWDYTKGIIIDLKTGEEIFVILRNYSPFWHKWIEHQNGKEYLLCGEDYQGYVILNLTEKDKYVCFDRSGFEGFGFCWIEVKEYNKDLNTIKVEGCYWGVSGNEIVEYDFSKPDEFPYVEISREDVIDDWDDDDFENDNKLDDDCK